MPSGKFPEGEDVEVVCALGLAMKSVSFVVGFAFSISLLIHCDFTSEASGTAIMVAVSFSSFLMNPLLTDPRREITRVKETTETTYIRVAHDS